MTLRERIIAEVSRVYFQGPRKASLAEDIADAILPLLEKRK